MLSHQNFIFVSLYDAHYLGLGGNDRQHHSPPNSLRQWIKFIKLFFGLLPKMDILILRTACFLPFQIRFSFDLAIHPIFKIIYRFFHISVIFLSSTPCRNRTCLTKFRTFGTSSRRWGKLKKPLHRSRTCSPTFAKSCANRHTRSGNMPYFHDQTVEPGLGEQAAKKVVYSPVCFSFAKNTTLFVGFVADEYLVRYILKRDGANLPPHFLSVFKFTARIGQAAPTLPVPD